MAQYRAEIVGTKGVASRLGSKKTGLKARVNGWNIGVTVECRYDEAKGHDIIDVYKTGGSNGGGRELIATVKSIKT